MAGFRTVPIDPNICEQARKTLKSPQYGHPVHIETAAGYGPCRSCLKQFRIGDDQRLLFTFNPFAGLDAYPSPGPVFIHAQECEGFSAVDGFPEELRSLPLTLEAYGDDRLILHRERPGADEIETAIDRCFETSGVKYIHLRNTEAGCFIARIERVAA